MAGQDNSTERVRAYRKRLAEGQGPQLGRCLACGREVRRLLQTTRDGSDELLCRGCWDKSPAGKAAGAARKRAQRAAKKAQQQDQGQA